MVRVVDLGTGTRSRLVVATLVVLLASPTIAGGLTRGESPARGSLAGVENVTFVSTQGGFGPGQAGRVVAIDTDTRRIVREFSRGDGASYYDVDPLSASELLVVEQVTGEGATALRVDWPTGTVLARFPVPPDTHDVDYLGEDRYVVADKFAHRVYVHDRSRNATV